MFVAFVFAIITYFSTIIIYRCYLSPVSSFPGPRLAAITFWYELYYDVLLKGQYTWKIEQLHRQYGPIVRINPEELHVNDPSFYEQVYVGPSRRTNKWPWSAQMFGTRLAAVGTVDHDIHRQRRAALNPFFSQRSVTHLEPLIQAEVDKLVAKLLHKQGQVVNLSDAFSCLSADVISDCAFGKTYGLLDAPNFAPEWRKFMMELSLGTHLMKQFGWAYRLVMATAPWALILVHPLSRKLNRLRSDLKTQIETIRASSDDGNRESHRTFFHALLHGDLPQTEKSTARLSDEALTIIGAGTVTTAHTLALTMYHILADPEILSKFQDCLREAYAESDTVTWTTLSQIPYLSATITEGLRLAFGVSHRLQRVSPDTDLHYKEWTIPKGTPVSQTQMFIMTDPTSFPHPLQFIPERWMPDTVPEGFPHPNEAKKYFIPFSKGTRSCVGMNLAYAELFLTLGTLLRPKDGGGTLEMELYETSRRDFEVRYDWFNPCPPLDSKGLQVLIK